MQTTLLFGYNVTRDTMKATSVGHYSAVLLFVKPSTARAPKQDKDCCAQRVILATTPLKLSS